MTSFDDFIRGLGLIPRGIAPDGKWRRCGTQEQPRKRNGAYKLALGGRIGWAQDWSTMSEPAEWRVGKDAKLPAFDVDAFRRGQQEAREAARLATLEARAFYERCAELRGGHPYLEAHGLDMRGCLGLKVDSRGWLVVPCLRGSAVMSLQRIAPDGTKLFWKGASVAGTTYRIERPGATVNVLCEGLATGLACYAALPTCRVIVTWNAGNLASVSDVPPGLSVIAADNDHWTEDRRGFNPGIEAAEKAAERLGCGVAYPRGIQGTDWSDYRQETYAERVERRGKYETRAQVRRAVDAEIGRELMRQARFVAQGAA